MKAIFTSLIFILVLFVSFNSCRKKEIVPTDNCSINYVDSSSSHPKKDQFQAVIDKYIQKGLPGLSVLLSDANGTWIGVGGKADIDKNISMQPCHVSKVASITKIFMGTLTLKLVEEGTFSLDDKINNWIPSHITNKIENADQATIRHLLGHTSGIYDIISDGGFYLAVLNNAGKKWNQEELLEFVYDKSSSFECGTGVEYSNTNYLLLAMVIDKATGKEHGQLLREKIFNPLNLSNSYYYTYDELPKNGIAQGYFDLYNNNTIINMSNYNTGSGNGYTGLYTTVHDLYIFSQALFVNKTILTQASLDEIETFNYSLDDDKKYIYGLGMQKDYYDRDAVNPVNPNEYGIGHRGRDLAYSADMFYFPNQDKTLIIIVNYGGDANSNLREVFFDFRVELADALLQ